MAAKGDNKLACALFFGKVNPENAQCNLFKCKICDIVRSKNKSGYTNLIDHLNDKHKKWRSVVERSKSKKPVKGALDKFFKKTIDPKYTNIYRWLNWIIKGKHPFSFVENRYSRKYSKLDPICTNTLMKYMNAVFERVKAKLAKLLPDSFGGIFDGWSCVREHYVAFFATWVTKEGNVAVRLLCCGVQDLPDEDLGEDAEDFGFTAADIGDYILNAALGRYGKNFENLEFLSGDNCSVNKLLVEGITEWYTNNNKPIRLLPLVGCGSHRLNVAVQKLWSAPGSKYYAVTQKIHKLHVSLRTLKNSFKLAAKSSVTAHLDNETRWTSMFKMVNSHVLIEPDLASCAFDLQTRLLFLTVLDEEEAKELLEFLKDIESVSKTTQLEDPVRNNLYTVRLLFDNLIRDYRDLNLETGIGKDAAIVHDKTFENAIVKLQGPSDIRLTSLEAEAVKVFKIDATAAADDVVEEKNESYAEKILRQDSERNQKKQKRSEYRSVAHVASNTNRCERLFSGTKLVMTDQRKCMDPSTLEMVTMLDENSDLWDALDVQEVALEWKRNHGEGKEEEPEIAAYESDSDDEDLRADVDLDVDIRAADDI
jgi:hypothetical protein